MDIKPVNLTETLASFDDVYSPRIVAEMNDCDVRIAHTLGEHVWHVHDDTDEFFLVLDGQFDITMHEADGRESTVSLRTGDTFVVPKGTEHKPSSSGGAILHVRAFGHLDHGRPPRGQTSPSTWTARQVTSWREATISGGHCGPGVSSDDPQPGPWKLLFRSRRCPRPRGR